MLARHWIAWLPPGYENVGSATATQRLPTLQRRPSARLDRAVHRRVGRNAGCVAVCASCVDATVRGGRIPAGRRAGMLDGQETCGGGFRGAVGGFRRGGDDVARRLRSRGVGRPARSPLLPGVAVGPSRPAAERAPTDASDPAADANPGSTVAAAAPIGPAILGVLLAIAVLWCSRLGCRSAAAAASRRDACTTMHGRPRAGACHVPTVDGKASAVARPASSPLYRVFVPVDAQQKPVGGKVYVPEAFYQELYRRAAPVEKPPAWLILGAVVPRRSDQGGRLRPARGRRAAGAIRSAGFRSGNSRAHSAANRGGEPAARQRVARRPRDRTGMGTRRRGLGVRGGRAGRLSPGAFAAPGDARRRRIGRIRHGHSSRGRRRASS